MTVKLRRWLFVLGILVAVGMLRVAQQTAVWRAAYRVGADVQRLHALENETAWLHADVLSLHSPTRLAGMMRNRRDQDKLVAWSELPNAPARMRVAQAEPDDR
ncbi:MAG: hypothetical protein HYY15_05070 [Candidatus Omnitrophica bacterium]|nr:hypothetical protein [Candidatus Omnitrophota bacterium]